MNDGSVTTDTARESLYDIIRDQRPFEEKARDALKLGEQYLDVENGHLTRIDPKTDHWEAIASSDPPDGQFPTGLTVDLETTFCRRTIDTESQIALSDAPNQGWDDDPAYETHGLCCYLGTPLVVDGEPYGTVCFVANDPRERFGDGETMFAELIAQLLERELERERHEVELTKQTNLAIVLNRVIRHNLRNDLSVIRGYTQMMGEESAEDPYTDTVLDNIDGLIDLAEKARQLDRIVATDFEREEIEVTALVDDIVQEVTAEYPNALIEVEYDEHIAASIFPSFERALTELIGNGVKHSGDSPTVSVRVEPVPNAVEVRISDDGPGLSDQEVDVLQSGTETALTHGSGLGLWLSHWVVTSHDGSIDAETSPEGTTMTVSVPRNPNSDVTQQLTKLRRAHDLYEAAFEAASDAMVIIDDEARIVDANREASTVYGMDHRDLLGQPIPRFLPGEFDFEAAWEAFKGKKRDRSTVPIEGGDGVERYVEYTAATDVIPGHHLAISRQLSDSEVRKLTEPPREE